MIALKKAGKQTAFLSTRPTLVSCAAVAGKREGECALGGFFDYVSEDAYFAQPTWEQAESEMMKKCFTICCDKAEISPKELDCIASGDLLNQCVSSTFALRDSFIPYLGLYGACSTMAESTIVASLMIECGYGTKTCAMTGSHFCSAERQFRYPLEYGGSKPPTAQCTVTGAGALILKAGGKGTGVSTITIGGIVDAGITDANNMGAAMAPAACDTLRAHFLETGRRASYYDAIFTGDLGAVGHDILERLMADEGLPLGENYMDCGVLIYGAAPENKKKYGSGCGCSASVLCGYILPEMKRGRWNKVLFAATGALMSTVTSQQSRSIPGICHAVVFENEVQ